MKQMDVSAVILAGGLAAGMAVASGGAIKKTVVAPKTVEQASSTEAPNFVVVNHKKCFVSHPKGPDGKTVDKTFCPDRVIVPKAPAKK